MNSWIPVLNDQISAQTLSYQLTTYKKLTVLTPFCPDRTKAHSLEGIDPIRHYTTTIDDKYRYN